MPALALVAAPALLGIALPLLSGDRPGTIVLAVGLAGMWLLAVAGHATARRARLDIGMRVPGRRGWIVAVCLGIVLMLAVPVLGMAGAAFTPDSGFGVRGTVWLVLAGAGTAAVTEEVIFRGVGITALEAAGVPTWAAAAISLFAFTLMHVGSWPLVHVLLVVLPLGAALTWCYVRVRNLPVVIVAHAIVDAPLVVLAIAC